MRGLALSFFLITLSFSGCIGEALGEYGQGEAEVRVGDGFEYRLWENLTFRTQIASVETLDFVGRSPCTGLVIERESSSSTGESQFCLDQTLHKESVSDREHPHTGDMIRARFFGGSLSVFETMIICAVACEGSAEELKWQWEHPPSQSGEAAFERLGNETYVYQSVLLHRGSTEFMNITFDFSEDKWPREIVDDRVSIHPNNDEGSRRFEQTLVWERIDEEEGTGEPVPFSKADEGVFTDLEGSSWTQFPKTGGAPFDYTIEEAYQDSKMHPQGIFWLGDHPDAFLSSSRYGVYDIEGGGKEQAWSLIWADGQHRLSVQCHRLFVSTPLGDVMTDQSCHDFESMVVDEEVHREDYPEETLDWGDLYGRWSDIGGMSLPINEAYWTIFSERPSQGSPSPDQQNASDRFTASFNFYEGGMDTSSGSPNWLVLPPGGTSRSVAIAESIFDPANGRPYLVQTPLE